ncbi:MAG: hypothetical protein ACKE51_07650 [Methylococcaceae bacterium]
MIKILWLLLMVSFDATATYDAGRVAFGQGDYIHAYELWLEAANGKSGSINDLFQWTHSSLEQQQNAQYAIAVLYWEGKGVDQDYQQAAKWLKLAMAAGHIKAQLKMGFLYLEGNGVDKNVSEARKYFIIPAESGYVDAQFNLGVMFLQGIGGEQSTSKAKYWLKKAAMQGDGQAIDQLMKFKGYSKNELLSKSVEDSTLEENVRSKSNRNNELYANSEVEPVTEVQQVSQAGGLSKLPTGNDEITSVLEDLPENFMVIESPQEDANNYSLELHNPTWLLQQTEKKYAIQVLALNSLSKLKSVTNDMSVVGDWVYFVKQRGIRKYYVLLRCCFVDKQVAVDIKQKFSSKIQKLEPYLIKLESVIPFVNLEQP